MSTETKQAEWAMAAANELLDESRESSWYLSAPEIIAAIIAKHAQTPGVDERLLAIAKIASSEIELGTLRDRFTKSTLEQLLSAIAEAESTTSQAAQTESEAIEAIEALRRLEKQFAIKCEATCMFADDLGAIEEARAILARHDQK